MAQLAINLENHEYSAEMHAVLHDQLLGIDGVFRHGNKLDHSIIDNNTVRVFDGLLNVNGRLLSIVRGTYEDFTIDNSSPGIKRIDLIIARFEKNGTIESHNFKVVKGDNDGTVPELINTDTIYEYMIKKITVDGTDAIVVEHTADYIPTIKEVSEKALWSIEEDTSSLTVGTYKEYLSKNGG